MGLGTRAHTVPFQCRMRVLATGLLEVQPTAQALDGEVAATLPMIAPVAGVGLGVLVQAVPFQCRISVLLPR